MIPIIHRALIALINEVKPGVAPDVATLDPTRRANNCVLGIKIAHDRLKIPQIISPYDLSSLDIDEKSMMTYLSYFCAPARAKLLKWLQKQLPQFKITNFTTNWADGKAFAALINTCHPGLYSGWASLESQKGIENNEMLFALTKKRLGVEPSFNARQLALSEVEELQVMTYIMRIKNSTMVPLPDEITISGPGIMKATAGKQTQFQIDTTRAGPGRLLIDAYYEDQSKLKFSLREKQSGVVTFTYTPRGAGTINFDILWSDIPIPNSPFCVRVTDSNFIRILDFEHHNTKVISNEPIELSLDTELAGQGALTAYLKYSKTAPVDAVVSRREGSVLTLRYTPTKAGKPVLHVLWDGQELTHLTITYNVIDSKSYQVISKPEDKVYHVYDHINFDVQSKGASLDVLQLTAIRDDELQSPISFQQIEGNLGIASFSPTLPGTYRIEVACIDKLIEGSPFKVKVADPSRCKLLEKVPDNLKLRDSFIMKVHTKDAGTGPLALECLDRETAHLFKTVVSKCDENGVQKIEATPLEEGDFLVSITFHGRDIPQCPFRVRVCDPSNCQISKELLELKNGAAGKPIRFQVTVRDPDSSFTPTIKASGPSAKYTTSIRKIDACTYSVHFTPWEVGTNEISVMYGGFHVQKSPYIFALIDSVDAQGCTATGIGLQVAFTGVPAQFVVLTKQEGLLNDGTLQVKVTGVISNAECKVRARDNKNGTYNVAYLVQTPGAYLVSIKARGQDIPGSPFKLNAQLGPDAESCRMYGPALEPNAMLMIGKPMDFSVDTKKAGVGQLSVRAVGPGGVQARVYVAKTERRGEYDIRLDPIKAGKYRTSVKWSGSHIPGSPFILKIFPGADASKCKAYGPGLENGLVGNPSFFTIETRNAGAGTLKVRLHGVRNAFKVDIKPVNPQDVRTLKANYDPQKPGEYLVTIKWSDNHIPGSPFRVKIIGDEVDKEEEQEEENGQKELPQATPRDPDLEPIMEVENEDELEDQSAKKQAAKKLKPKKKRKKSNQESREIDYLPIIIPMPKFNSDTRIPYHNTFVNRNPEMYSKSMDSLQTRNRVMPPRKMMTFSGLQQTRKHVRSASAPTKPIRGEYHGRAHMHLHSVNAKKLNKRRK